MSFKYFSQDWNSFCQKIPFPTSRKKIKFELSAFLKIEAGDIDAKAGIWIRADIDDEKTVFFDKVTKDYSFLKNWKVIDIKGEIDSQFSLLIFGGIIHSGGFFLYRDFKLTISQDNELYEVITIKNPNFKYITGQLNMAGWIQGIGKRPSVEVKEYIFSSRDNNCLEISGTSKYNDYLLIKENYNTEIHDFLYLFNDLNIKLLRVIQDLNQDQLYCKIDKNINSVANILLHLIAVEIRYQYYTFEQGYELIENELNKHLSNSINMEKNINQNSLGFSISDFISLIIEVKEVTFNNFKIVDKNWLLNKHPVYKISNYYNWLHVLEHQSNHIGQIILLKKLMKRL